MEGKRTLSWTTFSKAARTLVWKVRLGSFFGTILLANVALTLLLFLGLLLGLAAFLGEAAFPFRFCFSTLGLADFLGEATFPFRFGFSTLGVLTGVLTGVLSCSVFLFFVFFWTSCFLGDTLILGDADFFTLLLAVVFVSFASSLDFTTLVPDLLEAGFFLVFTAGFFRGSSSDSLSSGSAAWISEDT